MKVHKKGGRPLKEDIEKLKLPSKPDAQYRGVSYPCIESWRSLFVVQKFYPIHHSQGGNTTTPFARNDGTYSAVGRDGKQLKSDCPPS